MKPRSCVTLSEPESEPVSLSEIRDQLRLTSDQTADDDFLLAAAATARRLVERRLGVSLAPTRYRATWPAGATFLELPQPPVLVDQLHPLTVTVGGNLLAASEYELDADMRPAELTLDSTPAAAVQVTYWAGGALAPQLRSAILLYVGHLYIHREAASTDGIREVPMAFETLLASESVNGAW